MADAVRRLLRADGAFRRFNPSMLLRIAPNEAVEILADFARTASVTNVYEAGESLACAGMERIVLDWITSEEWRLREAGCIASEAFLRTPALHDGLLRSLYDEKSPVRDSATVALDALELSHWNEQLALRILAAESQGESLRLVDVFVSSACCGLRAPLSQLPLWSPLFAALPLGARLRLADSLSNRRRRFKNELDRRKRFND